MRDRRERVIGDHHQGRAIARQAAVEVELTGCAQGKAEAVLRVIGRAGPGPREFGQQSRVGEEVFGEAEHVCGAGAQTTAGPPAARIFGGRDQRTVFRTDRQVFRRFERGVRELPWQQHFARERGLDRACGELREDGAGQEVVAVVVLPACPGGRALPALRRAGRLQRCLAFSAKGGDLLRRHRRREARGLREQMRDREVTRGGPVGGEFIEQRDRGRFQ